MGQSVVKGKWITKKQENQVIYPMSITHKKGMVCNQVWKVKKPEYEVYVHVSGDCTATWNGNSYTIPEHSVSVYPAGYAHVHKSGAHQTMYERFVFLFHYEEVERLFDGLELQFLSDFKAEKLGVKPCVAVSSVLWQEIYGQCKKMAAYGVRDDAYSDIGFYADSLHFLTLVSKAFRENWSAESTGDTLPIIDMALAYIEDHAAEIDNVKALADYLRISQSYLARAFKKQVGVSPCLYLQEAKLKQSATLLMEGVSLTDACFRAGFNNYSYYIQVFRQKYGITPYKFVKKFKIGL